MSVVNRMLQDIDRRLGADTLDARYGHPQIRSVGATAPRGGAGPRTGWIGVLAVAAVAALAAAAWGPWDARPRPPAAASAAPPVVAARSDSAAQPAPAATPAPAQPLVAVAAQVEPEARPLPEPAKPASVVVEKPTAEPAPRPSMARLGPAEQFRLSTTLSPVAARPAAAPVAASPARGAEVPVRRVAAEETIDMARALWKGGAREEALATLREALAAAEGARNVAAAAPLARELARLELAAQRTQAALDLLRRLEGLLAEDADAWALRGNAEQRLSLHTEAAASYLAALRLRPAEGKWMLGAAISLAADGRQEEARGWVDRARERGAITPSIAAFLQQLGIAPRP